MVCRMAKVLKLDKTTWVLLVMIVGPVESFAVFLIGHYLSDVALASALIALVNSIAGILIWYFNAEEQQAPGNPPIPSTNSMPTTHLHCITPSRQYFTQNFPILLNSNSKTVSKTIASPPSISFDFVLSTRSMFGSMGLGL